MLCNRHIWKMLWGSRRNYIHLCICACMHVCVCVYSAREESDKALKYWCRLLICFEPSVAGADSRKEQQQLQRSCGGAWKVHVRSWGDYGGNCSRWSENGKSGLRKFTFSKLYSFIHFIPHLLKSCWGRGGQGVPLPATSSKTKVPSFASMFLKHSPNME